MATNTLSPTTDFNSVSDNASTTSYKSESFCNALKKYKCEHCSRNFTRLFTLRRHKKTIHDEESSEESDMSTDQNDSNAESSDENTSDSSDDERSSEADSYDEEENYPTSMFENLLCQTLNKHKDELDILIEEDESSKNLSDHEATKRAILKSKAALKTLRHLYAKNMIEINEQRRDPLYKAILNKAKELQDDGFSLSEAIASAVSYRKHAIHKLVNFV